MRQRFLADVDEIKNGLLEMGSLVLSQVERAVRAWEERDVAVAHEVLATDDVIDERCLDLDQRIFNLHLHDAPVAGDLRLLHVGLITIVALERVGDLAVSLARQAEAVSPEGAVPAMQVLIRKMSTRAVDALSYAVQGIAHGDLARGELAATEAAAVSALLGQLLDAAGAAAAEDAESRSWIASAVLVARNLDRVANNGRDLGGRVRFLTTGEHFRRSVGGAV